MKFISRALATVFSLLVLAAIGIGGYASVQRAIVFFAGIDLHFPRGTVVTSAAALLTALIVARSIRLASTQGKVNQLQCEKAETYRRFVEFYAGNVQGRGAYGGGINGLSGDVHTLERLLALYGSPAVIRAHTALRAAGLDAGPDARAQFGKALIAIRKDLGMQRSGLMPADLQRLVLRDDFDRLESARGAENGRHRPVALSNLGA